MDDLIRKIIEQDDFASFLGAELVLLEDGHAIARLELTGEHRNFLGLVHGAAIFGLADVAFGAAANSWGLRCAATHINIDYLRPPGDTPALIAEVRMAGRAGRTCFYEMAVTDAEGEKIAALSGWAYQTRKPLTGEETLP